MTIMHLAQITDHHDRHGIRQWGLLCGAKEHVRFGIGWIPADAYHSWVHEFDRPVEYCETFLEILPVALL